MSDPDQLAFTEADDLPTVDQAPPRSPIDDLIPGQLPPEDFDPLADGILMQHQRDWVADTSTLKLCEKGRRTGITFAEALDSTLIAAAAKSAGGDTTYYIGDTKDKGLEFVSVCARFARTVAQELLVIDEFVFEDLQEDGSTKAIAAYRIRFASGHQIVALSSNPANIRGLQGRVVIDEAAFHRNVAKVIDACNALLIWGGVIRIISTHNGALNAFAELVKDARAGTYDYSVHRVTFDDAVENGLYERVCLMRGWAPSSEGKSQWYRKIRKAYGSRVDAMREELDAIAREGEGALLPLAWIEKCSTSDYKVMRWEPPAEKRGGREFTYWPEDQRQEHMLDWLTRNVLPQLLRLSNLGLTLCLGGDFAMRQDRSSYPLGYTAQDLTRHVPLIVELRRCPYDQQRQTLFWLVDRVEELGRFGGGVLDANGNGMALAQECAQRFGPERIVELMWSAAWSREYGPPFRAAFEDGTILIPADLDTRNDLRQLVMSGGVAKLPSHVRNEGTDGGKRHGDNAIGLWNFYAASMDPNEAVYDYRSAASESGSVFGNPFADADPFGGSRGWWNPPLGTGKGAGGPI